MTNTTPNKYAQNWSSPPAVTFTTEGAAIVIAPTYDVARTGQDPLILLAHGLLGQASDFLNLTNMHDDWRTTAGLTKVPTVAGNFGGVVTWGNSTAVHDAVRFMELTTIQRYGATPYPANSPYRQGDQSQLIGYGQSMGAALICNMAIRFPHMFKGLILLVPAVDLLGLRDDNVSGFASTINSSYGGSSQFTAAAPYWSPLEYVDRLVGIFGPNISVFYSTEDTVIPPDYVQPFAAKVALAGGYVENMGGDHGDALTEPSFPQKLATEVARIKHTSKVVRPNNRGLSKEFAWWEVIRKAGAGTGNFKYMGGDVTDATVLPNGTRAWIGADWFFGSTVSSLDYYGGAMFPNRNGVVIEGTDGILSSQVFASGTNGNWYNHDAGLYPTATNYWPICSTMENGVLRVGSWLIGSGGPYGDIMDSHIVSFNATTLAVTGTAMPFNDSTGQLWIEGFLTDTEAGYTYVYFEEFLPPYDADIANNGSVPNYGKGDLQKSVTYHRVARVPIGSLLTLSAYRWWDGTNWNLNKSNAKAMVDTNKRPLSGDTGFCKSPTGTYMAASHQLVANHFKVYSSPTPTGPWTWRYDIPAADMGTQQSGGNRIGQLTKLLPDVPSSPGTIMSLTSMNNLNTTAAWTDRHISLYSPRFVEIPYV